MPSSPSLQALTTTIAPSAASASLNRIPLTPRLLVVARFRAIAAELAARGHLAASGKPFEPSVAARMLEGAP